MSSPFPFEITPFSCRISQGDQYLTRENDRAVTTTLSHGNQFFWKITALESHPPVFILNLLPPQNEHAVDELLLTLDVLTQPGMKIPISVVPRMTGADRRQAWTLRDVELLKLDPLQFTAKIDSYEIPDLVAATGDFLEKLPNPFFKVDAVPKGHSAANETWLFDYSKVNE